MFDNIGGKIKMVAKLLCWIGIAASVIGGIGMICFEMVLAGAVTIVAGCLCLWLGSLCLYGFGELIEETARSRKVNERLLDALNGQIKTDAAPTGAESAAAIGTDKIDAAKSPAWQCKKCLGYNTSTEVNCKFCGKNKE